jgi:hypothetical protein
MTRQGSDPAQWKYSAGIFALLILAIFTTELAAMELFSPLFSRLGSVAGGLLDAGGVMLLCASPIWFYLFRLFPPDTATSGQGSTPRILPIKALAGIFVAEFLVMILLPHLWPGADSLTWDLADAALTTLHCALLLRRLLFRPEMRRRSVPMMDTPLRLYVLLLLSVPVRLAAGTRAPFSVQRTIHAQLNCRCYRYC